MSQDSETEAKDVLNRLGAEFDLFCQARHNVGAKEYGPTAFIKNNMFRMIAEEMADIANYCRYQFIKLSLMEDQLTRQPNELAWAAGFFDGEGHTAVYNEFSDAPKPKLQINQSSDEGVPEVLIRFQNALGGLGKIYGPYKPGKNSVKRGYSYQLQNKDAIRALIMLWPYLGTVKRLQAQNIEAVKMALMEGSMDSESGTDFASAGTEGEEHGISPSAPSFIGAGGLSDLLQRQEGFQDPGQRGSGGDEVDPRRIDPSSN